MDKKTFLILLVIIAIAGFFRLWQLDSIPPGLYPDEAINGNDALTTLKTSNFKVFYPENNGREGLFIWLIALSFSVFGVSIWSIKIVAATIGILTVLGLYLLTKEIFKNLSTEHYNSIALLSSFFLATSFWHTNFSRIGFRAILLPFILVFGFYFLFKGFQTLKNFQSYTPVRRSLYFVLAGLFFGLGFYTYISYRFIVLLLPLLLIPWWFISVKENFQKQYLVAISFLLLVIIITALPIGIYFLKNPQDFIGRAAPISIFTAENPIKELGKSLILHLGMFNFYGDPNWRHNFAGSPMFPWTIGILFLIGLAFSLFLLIKISKSSLLHSNRILKISVLGFLANWFLIMLLPGILTYEGLPHALRTIGVIPVVYIFAGLGGFKVYQFFYQHTKRKKLLLFSSFLFLLVISFCQYNKYFVTWAKNPNVESAFTKKFVEIGYYLNSLPPNYQKYLIVNEPGVPVPYPDGIPMPAQTIMFIENSKYSYLQSIYLLPENLDRIRIERETIVVPMAYNENLFKELSEKFPQGQIKKINEIWIYEIR